MTMFVIFKAHMADINGVAIVHEDLRQQFDESYAAMLAPAAPGTNHWIAQPRQIWPLQISPHLLDEAPQLHSVVL